VRFDWFKDRHSDNTNAALVPPETGLVQIVVEGQPNLGSNSELPRIYPSENRFELSEGLAVITGRHSLKFGAGLIGTQDFLKYLPNRYGTYEYADFTHFALDFSGNTAGARNWQTYSQRFGNEIFDQTIREYDFYAEDQYRPLPNLTLNAGLRYEYASLPQPRANPDYPDSGQIDSKKTNFAPRVGVSWAFNQSKTLLRAGYGIFYARYHSGVIGTFFMENGVDQQSVVLERRFFSDVAFGPVFPNALPAPIANRPPGPADPNFASAIDLTLPSKDYRNPYTQQADVTLEHAISPRLDMSVSYLWSRGLHLTTVRDLNIGPPTSPVVYEVDDAAGKLLGTYSIPAYKLVNRVNPRWRRVNSVESGGNSYYNAMVVQLRRRLAKGFEAFASYTWSHAIDFNQGGGTDNIFFSDGPRTLFNGDYRGEKASSQLDQRHRLVVNSTYEPRISVAGRRGLLANGWRFSQITTLASAQPATATVLVSGVPFPGAAFNNTLNGLGGSTRVPFWPASALDLGRVIRTDARLTKIFRIADRHQVHLNFEAFNVFNHVSTTAVSTVAFEAKDQVLTPVPDLGKSVASQGYPDGTNARRAQVSVRFLW
jgi:hypothetical protein